MEYAIIASKQDEAGMNIKECLLRLYNFEDRKSHHQSGNIMLYEVKEESIYCDNIDKITTADIIIFATKHKSAAGKNSLSVHVPGNWAKAELGGRDRTLCVAPASLLKEMFLELNEQGKDLQDYEITLETIHHGPYVEKPIMFIEIGSQEEQWKDKKVGEIIAKTIMNVLKKEVKRYKTVIAFGSSHYPQPFNKFLSRTEYAIGQMCPKYMLESLDEEMVKQAMEKNVEKVEFALLDWKGLGQYKEKVTSILDKLKINHKKAKEFI